MSISKDPQVAPLSRLKALPLRSDGPSHVKHRRQARNKKKTPSSVSSFKQTSEWAIPECTFTPPLLLPFLRVPDVRCVGRAYKPTTTKLIWHSNRGTNFKRCGAVLNLLKSYDGQSNFATGNGFMFSLKFEGLHPRGI